MRSLVLLALVTLAALPLSARDHWRGPRRVVVVAPRCEPPRYWEERRHEHRYENRHEHRYEHRYEQRAWSHHDCDDDRVVLRPMPRPLTPPFEGRFELRLR